MRWYPVIEYLNDLLWYPFPTEALTGTVSVDMKHGQAHTASFTVRRSELDGGVDAWVFKRIRISYMYAPTVAESFIRETLFSGFVQGLEEQAIAGLVTMECTSITTRIFKKSPAILAQLESEVPWSDYVFGVRGELNAEEQFEKLLNASDYALTETGLVPLSTLLNFTSNKPGDDVGLEASYDHFHRASDVIAGGPTNASSAISLKRSDPKLSAPRDDPRLELFPGDVIAKAPVNEIICIVRHRFTRLCQETFTFSYEGGNIVTDWAEKNARFLTNEAWASAIDQSGLRPVGVNYVENPPPSGTNIGTTGAPLYFVSDEKNRLNLISKFTYHLARRYTQPVEMVYQKTIREPDSIGLFGLSSETRELTIEDDADFSDWGDWKLMPKLAATGYVEVSTAAQFVRVGKVGKGTKEAADLALGALVGEAKHAIKVAHSAMLSGAIGSNSAITTSYKVPMTGNALAMRTGNTCALETPYTTAVGLIAALRYDMDSSGAATCSVELITSVIGDSDNNAPEVVIPENVPLAVSKGYRNNPIGAI